MQEYYKLAQRLRYWLKFIGTYRNFPVLIFNRVFKRPITFVTFWNSYVWEAEADTLMSVVMDESLVQENL